MRRIRSIIDGQIFIFDDGFPLPVGYEWVENLPLVLEQPVFAPEPVAAPPWPEAVARGVHGEDRLVEAVEAIRAGRAYRGQYKALKPVQKYKDFEKTISSVFNKRAWSPDKEVPYIGLELENEFLTDVKIPIHPDWCIRSEGSLRYFGFEYVQAEPKTLLDSFAILKELLVKLKEVPEKLLNSKRSSTHVHFDVTRYNFLDLTNFASLYWILEPFISHYCGKDRKGNLFCLRLQDSTTGQTYLKEAIKSYNPWSTSLVRNEFRYASLNMASIPKFGSLEFRLLRGTDDYDVIRNWVLALAAIKSYALGFSTPRDLNTHFIKDVQASDLPRAVLGDKLFAIFKESFPAGMSIEKEIRNGFLSVCPILTAHKTFDFQTEIKEERRLNKLERERLLFLEKEILF